MLIFSKALPKHNVKHYLNEFDNILSDLNRNMTCINMFQSYIFYINLLERNRFNNDLNYYCEKEYYEYHNLLKLPVR
jgi:hypothetical protein